MFYLIFIPIIFQVVALFFDEFYYHWKRGLPKWERIGHPVDTFAAAMAFGVAAFCQFNEQNIYLFIGLSFFSTLLVTKDEFVHVEECEPREIWLHAVLFVIHPLVFVSTTVMWYLSSKEYGEWPDFFQNNILNNSESVQYGLIGQFIFVSFFMCYQIMYWNFIWKSKK